MAVPKKKVSIAKKKQRTSTRRTLKIKKTLKQHALIECDNCKTLKQNHHVCPACGYYREKQILTIKSKASDSVIQA